ncbi:DEAD/DEAH box helicase [Helcobacillus massiliensis]|uniref:DEAD/DEAH box helicase n=1 Tax=Helcobacillus massiliensis TaxID=521392 RepID=UPI0021A26626|nr:DEAD/DEAH box helicase [Helcobacillus massiliensis]MCT1558439.1 DEAD/DEAH box helicase [Helcobacillus massiliensis]MCT2037013.1 DEAD/DEAH box helicase [Helcobacillus massiliensis]MCT2332706.1 DEAD/DEAH box helicase [Helcobacillus massiliensis]
MTQHVLHLVLDPVAGASLWAHVRGDDGRARLTDDLGPLVERHPSAFRPLMPWVLRPMRQRSRADGRAKDAPLMLLTGVRLARATDVLRGLIEVSARASGRLPSDSTAAVASALDDLIVELADTGSAIAVTDDLALAADALSVLALDVHARRLVTARQVVPQIDVQADTTTATWATAAGITPHPWLTALADAHARDAFAALLRDIDLPDGDQLEGVDPVGAQLIAALGPDAAALTVDVPGRRRLTRLLGQFADTGADGVLLHDAAPDLVVRVHEPDGTADDGAIDQSAWRIEACLRENGGTVHPLDSLVSVGDLSMVAALEHTAAIRSHSPILRGAKTSRSGMEWTVNTHELSRFISADAADLAEHSIVVMLPRTWTKQAVTVRATVQDPEEKKREGADANAEKSQKGQSMTGAIGSFSFTTAIGDTDLTDEEMQDILTAQADIVQLRGEWIRLDRSTLAAAERFLDAFSKTAYLQSAEQRRFAQISVLRGGTKRAPQPPGDGDAAAALGAAASAPGTATGADGDQRSLVVPPRGDMSVRQWVHLLTEHNPEDLRLTIGGKDRGAAAFFTTRAAPPTVPAPTTLKATLRPYQQRGLEWMAMLDGAGLGGILADDMGLGKTMQVLALLCWERENADAAFAAADADGTWGQRVPVGPTLLVCPMSVIGSWQREAATFAPHLRVHVHHGPQRLTGDDFATEAMQADLILTTYALMARDLPDLQLLGLHRVILDEAQHIKNADTQVSRASRQLPEGRRLALTGTPVENDLTDLHSIMEFANPGLLGGEDRFKETYARPIQDDHDEDALEQLNRVTGAFILRRLKTDRSIIRDLPDKTEMDERITLTPEQAGLISAIGEEMTKELAQVDRTQRKALISSTVMRIKQVCNHPAHYLGDGSPMLEDGQHRSGKMDRIDDLLESIISVGEKALIFTQFTQYAPQMIEYWQDRFGIEVPFLHGGLPKAERDHMVAEFQKDTGQAGVMLLSLRAGGTGITLTAANHVIHLDRWWNPAVENQATDRAFRIGQKRNVTVRRMVAIGTIEEAIAERLAMKSALADATVAAGERWLQDLDDDRLADLFTVTRDAEGNAVSWSDESRKGALSDGD